MLDYTGHACPCCNKPFAPDDDIVVCPECGAPYHRACYQKEGRCLFEGLHSPEFAWKPAPSEAAPVTCPSCGAGNAETAIFCTHCGTRLQEPEEDAADPYAHLFEEGAFGPFGRLFTPGETLCDIPVQTWAAFLGASSPYYLLNFKRMELTGRKLAVSFSAFLLGPFYFFYRKMYKWGFIFGAVSFLLTIPTYMALLVESGSALTAGLSVTALKTLMDVAFVLSWVMMIVRGMVALWLYRETAANRIRAILARWKDEGSQQAALNALGGTSIGAAILYGVLISALTTAVLFKLGGPELFATYAGAFGLF